MAVGAHAKGNGDGGEQDLVLGLEPSQCLPAIVGSLGVSTRSGRGEGDLLPRWLQQEGGVNRRVQVVVQDPADRGFPVGRAVVDPGLIGGVGAQQVVEGVPAGCVLGDQAVAGQFTKQAAGLGLVDRGKAGGGADADVRAGVEAQQPEHAGRISAELPVGPGEHGMDADGWITGIQDVQAAGRVAQFIG